MDVIPPRPSCYGQTGRLACPCNGAPKCIESRYFWIAALTVADMKCNADRREYLAQVASTKGHGTSRLVRAAAIQIIDERKTEA